MGGDEIGARETIAVEEDHVDALGGEDGAVANLGGAKAAVLVPDMGERAAEPALPGGDQVGGRRRRAVVGDDHLEILVALARERTQHGIERVLAVIGGDDDGNQFGHGGPSAGWLSRTALCRQIHRQFKGFAYTSNCGRIPPILW